MAWRGGALVIAAAAVFTTAALAVNPGPPAIPVGSTTAPTSTSPAPAGPDVTVAESSKQAGAQPVALTLSFDATLVCGHVRGTTTVALPNAANVPDKLSTGDVMLNGRAAGKVTVDGSTVTILPPAVHGMLCHSIVLTTMRVSFTRAAGIGNPKAGGTYAIVVHRGGQLLRGSLAIAG